MKRFALIIVVCLTIIIGHAQEHLRFIDTPIDGTLDGSCSYLIKEKGLGAPSMTEFAQEVETTKPLTDTEVVRKVALLDVEGKDYYNVVMTFKSISPDYFITDKYKVKVTVKDLEGKTVWQKTLKNVFLYVFSDGQIQVGQKKFNQIIVQKSRENGAFYGMVREKEGVY